MEVGKILEMPWCTTSATPENKLYSITVAATSHVVREHKEAVPTPDDPVKHPDSSMRGSDDIVS
jgi:hypothetical protein